MTQYQFRDHADNASGAGGGSGPSVQVRSSQNTKTLSQSNNLEIVGLGKRYASQQASGGVLQVLENINLNVQAGQFVSIVGASGCGKSTLLRLVLGLDSEYEGQILIGGQAISGTGRDRGIVFQDHRLFPWLTVAQNVGVALRNSPFNAVQKRDLIAEHIALVGLEGFEQSYPHQISGGMAQRVAIARGLVNRPSMLLLDEPLGALDALTRSRLQVELQRIWEKEKITMLLVTHDVDEAVFLGDRVVVMEPHPGRIKRTVEIDLPRERNRSDPDFIRLRDDVLSDFLDIDVNQIDTQPLNPSSLPRSFADLRMTW